MVHMCQFGFGFGFGQSLVVLLVWVGQIEMMWQ